MSVRFRTCIAAAFAGVMALTAGSALAAEPAPTPAPSATPLQTRPAKKLELSAQNEKTPVGYKLLAGAVVVAGAVVWAKKKKGGVTKDKKKRSAIDLLARHSVGVRSELLVVDVEGTRLLVGMTPGSMSTLAVLQTPEGVVGEESPLMGEEKYLTASEEDDDVAPVKVAPRRAAPEPEEVDELENRVRSLLDARKRKAEAPISAPSPRAMRKTQPMPASRAVPGQAKGLLLSMQDADVTKLGDW